MNILFVSLSSLEDLGSQSIYGDLLKTFYAKGHNVYSVTPREKRTGLPTEISVSHGVKLLKVSVGNITKCGLIEKGLSTLSIERQYAKAIQKYFSGVDFDLILYSTPPTTLYGVVEMLKKETGASSYLLLKDIFPQNSIDLGMLSKSGIKGLIYRYFKMTERKTYAAADYIGCMSEANRDYLIAHEGYLDPDDIEVNPNSVIPSEIRKVDRSQVRDQYGIPHNARVVVYGGNLGKPQAIDYLVRVLRENENRGACYFVIAGSGTERYKLEKFFGGASTTYSRLLPHLSPESFDELLLACDIGLVLLDHNFTIPNFPSRSLSYMQASLPIVAATDDVCDLGQIAQDNGFGKKTNSINEIDLLEICCELEDRELKEMGAKGRTYLEENYTSERSYEVIMRHYND